MKIITKKKQKEIDKINIKRIAFTIKITYEKYCELEEIEYKDLIAQAENIYYADDVIFRN